MQWKKSSKKSGVLVSDMDMNPVDCIVMFLWVQAYEMFTLRWGTRFLVGDEGHFILYVFPPAKWPPSSN